MKNGVPACVSKTQPDVYFSLRSMSALSERFVMFFPSPDTVTPPDSPVLLEYNAMMDAYAKDSVIALEKVDKDKQLADAFAELQVAENVRDKSPEAYQQARTRYYTLKNGESWVAEEEARIRSGEAQEKANEFLTEYAQLTRREQQQTKTMDVVNAVKDNLLSMKDDFELTTGAFAKQLSELKSQIQMEKTRGALQTASVLSWVGTLLNVLLVGVLLVAIVLVVRKRYASSPTTTSSPPS